MGVYTFFGMGIFECVCVCVCVCGDHPHTCPRHNKNLNQKKHDEGAHGRLFLPTGDTEGSPRCDAVTLCVFVCGSWGKVIGPRADSSWFPLPDCWTPHTDNWLIFLLLVFSFISYLYLIAAH